MVYTDEEIRVLLDRLNEKVAPEEIEPENDVGSLHKKVDSLILQKKPLTKQINIDGIDHEFSGKRVLHFKKKQDNIDRLIRPYLRGEFIASRTFEEMFYITNTLLSAGYVFGQDELYELIMSNISFSTMLRRASKKIKRRSNFIRALRYKLRTLYKDGNGNEFAYRSAITSIQREILITGIPVVKDSILLLIKNMDIVAIIAQTIKIGSPIILSCIFLIN